MNFLGPIIHWRQKRVGSVSIGIATAVLTLTGYAPAVSVTDHKSVTVASASVLLTGNVPSVASTSHITIPVQGGTLSLSGSVPVLSLTDHKTVSPSAGAIIVDGKNPDVIIGTNIAVDPGVLTVSGSGPAVTITAHQTIPVAAGTNQITGRVPQVGITVPIPSPGGGWKPKKRWPEPHEIRVIGIGSPHEPRKITEKKPVEQEVFRGTGGIRVPVTGLSGSAVEVYCGRCSVEVERPSLYVTGVVVFSGTGSSGSKSSIRGKGLVDNTIPIEDEELILLLTS